MTIWRFQNLAGPAYTKWDFTVLPLWQPLANIGIEIGLQGFRIWTEVRIRIKNLQTLAHVCFLLARKAATFTPSLTQPSVLVNNGCLALERAKKQIKPDTIFIPDACATRRCMP